MKRPVEPLCTFKAPSGYLRIRHIINVFQLYALNRTDIFLPLLDAILEREIMVCQILESKRDLKRVSFHHVS